MSKTKHKMEKEVLMFVVLAMLFLAMLFNNANIAISAPGGPEINITKTETAPTIPGTQITTAGGTIATMTINGTTQNPHWKAFVGNISGKLTLDDANNNTIYDWSLADPTGEVYVSRASSINWSGVDCANSSHVSTEETAMNHTASAPDSIGNTFDSGNHKGFSTGAVEFTANECTYSMYTYVNSSSQSAVFSSILISDSSNLIYTTVIEQNVVGFDLASYDFQMIVAEKGAGPTSSTPYYLYVELS